MNQNSHETKQSSKNFLEIKTLYNLNNAGDKTRCQAHKKPNKGWQSGNALDSRSSGSPEPQGQTCINYVFTMFFLALVVVWVIDCLVTRRKSSLCPDGCCTFLSLIALSFQVSPNSHISISEHIRVIVSLIPSIWRSLSNTKESSSFEVSNFTSIIIVCSVGWVNSLGFLQFLYLAKCLSIFSSIHFCENKGYQNSISMLYRFFSI